MKKIKNFYLPILFLVLSVGFVSCDNSGEEPQDPMADVQGGTNNSVQSGSGATSGNSGNSNSGTSNTPVTGTENGYAWVDLGLSVKWATCNVGADSVHHYGGYYAWGETTTKEAYTSENYTYAENPEVLPLDRDAAAVNMGGEWRMPTNAEIQELIDGCDWATTTLKGVDGYIAISKTNAATIFLPAAGLYTPEGLTGAGAGVVFYSSTFNSDTEGFGFLGIPGEVTITTGTRCCGLPVRGVIK